jgi:SWI/SNF-related matrix-associated actin-dependent regulator 1 of chromatin subfamily A
MIRRLKSEVLTELPPKRRIVVELSPPAEVLRQEQGNLQRMGNLFEQAGRIQPPEAGEADSEKETYKEAIERLSQEKFAEFAEFSRIRHDTAVAKIPYAIDFISQILEEKDKVVVFAHHRDVIEAIHAHFGARAVKLTGGEKNLEIRQQAIDRFQQYPEVKVFVGSIQAAGVGITLTAADTEIFVELDPVPGNVTQAEDRCHRIGQLNMVTVYHVVFADSIDCQLAYILLEKQEIIDRALDKFEADISVTGSLLQKLAEKTSTGTAKSNNLSISSPAAVKPMKVNRPALDVEDCGQLRQLNIF